MEFILSSQLHKSFEDISDIVDQFNECLPDYDMNKLKLVYKSTCMLIFTPVDEDSSVARFVISGDGDWWATVPQIIISTEQVINHSGYDAPQLLMGSSDAISYELYPFEQCKEVPLEILLKLPGLVDAEHPPVLASHELVNSLTQAPIVDDGDRNKLPPNLREIPCRTTKSTTRVYKWIDDMQLEIDSDKYRITKKDKHNKYKFVSGFIDSDSSYQEGDCCTNCYLNIDNNDLIIENRGDVSSVVIIKYILQ
jgi:hypothetical protein